MPAIGPDRFARDVGSLDAEELARLVADAWGARGWEVAVDGATVEASGGPLGRTRRIRCVAPGRTGLTALPAGDVDVVVSSRASRRVEAAAEQGGARYVGPPELRAFLLYALPRETAEGLYAEHVGRPLVVEEQRAPLRSRLGASVPRPVLLSGVLLVLLAGVVLAGAGGVAVPFDGVGPETSTTEPGGTGTPAASVTPEPATRAAPGYPPGVGPEGVVDADALATAHGQATVGTTYNLLIVHHGSEDLLVGDRRWTFSRQTVARVSPIHFWYRFAGVQDTENGTREVVFDDYADHTYVHRRVAGPGSPEYRRGLIPTGGGNGLFTALAEAYVGRYLATDRSRVEAYDVDGERRFRVVATGTPTYVRGAVSAYRAEAVVDADGRVHRLTARYTRPVSNDTTVLETPAPEGTSYETVVFELVYRDVGGTMVAEPAWYDEARNATNRTVVDLWSIERDWWTRPEGRDFETQP